ncbi:MULTISPECIES: phosphatase [unclassified Candidatus Frackibacter]|uniref:phosphatase n=1 Tax=unclassified Candidatus Frackibacter TaxID=2648818 RepID=UPI0008866A96|nr:MULTISPECIES: phosphatase [unclassified Candidatus Frackibacter]SDC70546.1 putative hydrolase [Candidatus Frackibacter sp. WG11]SFL94216.1 putative hydrolase [Candidatus Frackibacter sp. WG13]
MKIVADLHTHTISSGHAYSTLEEMVAGAKENGIQILGTTDHGPSMPGGCHPYYFYNLPILPSKIEGVRVLKGVETNITDLYGTLDLPIAALRKLDIVLAGMHPLTGFDGGSKAENTKAMINAIKNPLVDVIVHPGNPQFEIDAKEVVRNALEYDVLLEINNSSFRKSRQGSYDNCLEIARQAKECGLNLILSSDAHFSRDVGRVDKAIDLVKKVGLSEDNIVNTSYKRINKFSKDKAEIKQSLKSNQV